MDVPKSSGVGRCLRDFRSGGGGGRSYYVRLRLEMGVGGDCLIAGPSWIAGVCVFIVWF